MVTTRSQQTLLVTMGRGGHGPGMGGAGHSHDAEYPDDDWNLYQHLDEVCDNDDNNDDDDIDDDRKASSSNKIYKRKKSLKSRRSSTSDKSIDFRKQN